jgi:hypothetical protein
MAHKSLYLYLGKRDKKGIRVISIFPGKDKNIPATRIQDISDLSLSPVIEASISKTIYDNRMLWEPWLEGADNFKSLKAALRDRGYTNLPTHSMPAHRDHDSLKVYFEADEENGPQEANVKKIKDIYSMLRKKS